jgi:hypothetical protein
VVSWRDRHFLEIETNRLVRVVPGIEI